MAGKKFDRDQVRQSLRKAGISDAKATEVIDDLTGETQAPPKRTRGGGPAAEPKSDFTL